DPLAIGCRDPRSLIAYANDPVSKLAIFADRDLDRGSAQAVADRVLEKVVQDLIEPRRISMHEKPRRRERGADLTRWVQDLGSPRRRVRRAREVEGRRFHLERVGGPREDHKVIREADQAGDLMLRLLERRRDAIAPVVARRITRRELEVAGEGRERI